MAEKTAISKSILTTFLGMPVSQQKKKKKKKKKKNV